MKLLLAWLMMLCVWVALPARGCEIGCQDECGKSCTMACAKHENGETAKHRSDDPKSSCDGHHGCQCSCHGLPLCAEPAHTVGFVMMNAAVQLVRGECDRLPDEPFLGSKKPPLI